MNPRTRDKLEQAARQLGHVQALALGAVAYDVPADEATLADALERLGEAREALLEAWRHVGPATRVERITEELARDHGLHGKVDGEWLQDEVEWCQASLEEGDSWDQAHKWVAVGVEEPLATEIVEAVYGPRKEQR